MRRYVSVILLLVVVATVCGCTLIKIDAEKIQNIEYTIVSSADQPEEIRILIEDNKASKMKISYMDQSKEYIVIGYGEQATSGYSVVVQEVYETENAMCVKTNLVGPSGSEEIIESPSYPYVVICIEENEKPIMYE